MKCCLYPMLVGEEQTISTGTPNVVALVEYLWLCNYLCIDLHVYLPDFNCFSYVYVNNLLNCAMLKFVNKLVYGLRVHQNTWGRVSQAQNGVWKRDDEVWNLCNIWYIWHGCQQMCRWTMAVLLHLHSGFPAKLMKQMIMTSIYDVTRFSHAIEGGKYKRRA